MYGYYGRARRANAFARLGVGAVRARTREPGVSVRSGIAEQDLVD